MSKAILFLYIVLSFYISIQAQNTKNSVGKSQVFEGVVKTLILEDKTGTKLHFLDTGEHSFRINLKDESLRNAKVSITGRLNAENTIEVEQLKVLKPSDEFAGASVAGPRRVLVLILNFQNHPEQPVAIAGVRWRIFTRPRSPNEYFRHSSEGRFWLEGRLQPDGDIFGYYTLPFTDENCTPDRVYNVWRPAADDLASAAGINVNLYETVLYLFSAPAQGCSNLPAFADLGTIGGQTTQRVFITNAFADNFDPYSENFDQTVAHEIGHNLGLNHVSGYVNCPTNVPFENCSFQEYADRTEVMGLWNFHLLCNYHRLRLGWLNGKVEKFESPGVYYVSLKSPNQITKGTTAAQIRLKNPDGSFVGKSLYLEYRHNRPPFDLFNEELTIAPTMRFADKGITIRVGNENLVERLGRFFMIDTTPDTLDFGDAPLLPGKSYTHNYYGIKITTIAVNPFFGAKVKIEINFCPSNGCQSIFQESP